MTHPATAPARLPTARILTVLLFALIALYIALTFGQHGISNDEEVQHIYGRLLLDYYGSGLTDLSAFQYKNLYLYGGLFDLIAATGERLLPAMNVWDMRHLLSALFGLAGMVAVHRLARLLLDEWAACVAVLLLMLTGAWSGALFTHTKDIPFAASMAWATWYTTRVVLQLPAPPLATVLKLGAAIGCAFGLRVGAVFSVMTLGLTVLAISATATGDWRAKTAHLLRSLRALLPAVPVAVALMALFWPWSMQAPGNLFKALTTFSHFTFQLYTVLDGEVMKIGDVPRSYLPTYLAVRMPELTLAGLALALPAAIGSLRHRPGAWRRWLPVVLAASLPILLAVATRPSLYNGIRHFTFLLPPLAVIAAGGLHAGWQVVRQRRIRALCFAALCLLGVAAPLAAMTRLAPYHYLNYNLFGGGFAGAAAGRWETDYWSDGVREATSQLNAYLATEAHPAEPWQVAVCAESVQAGAWLGPDFIVTRDWVRADFFISTTHMACDEVLRGKVIGQVMRAGSALTIVKDRRTVPPEQRRPLR
ncbi:MAG TPA: glycosyltransferase family 39 protein [Methyloversatilis sp.]